MAKKGAKIFAKASTPEKKTVAAAAVKKQIGDRRKSNEPIVEQKIIEEDWEDEDDDSEDGSEDDGTGIDYQRLEDINDTDSESELDSDEDDEEDEEEEQNDTSKLSLGGENSDSEGDESQEDSEIDVDDLELDNMDEEDKEELTAGTRVRQTINNKEGLLSALRRIALVTDPKTVPFTYHMSVVSSKPTEEAIESIEDDLQRELAFANQALEAARQARKLLKKEGVPFTRPTDYFAETLRSDDTMNKVKAKLIEDATAKKASAEARKLRDLKKFGKQVQVQKQQDRAKEKRQTLEKITELKRKRKDGGSSALGAREADDLFDVAVDNELGSSNSRQKSAGNGGTGRKRSAGGDYGPPGAKRQKKDAKYGFGGKKRFAKSGDAMSSGDVSGFSAKRMKNGGGAGDGKKHFSASSGPKGSKPRLGKARRTAQAGRR